MENEESPPSRLSFRSGKMSENHSLPKNQFGHTVLGTNLNTGLSEDALEVRLESTGRPNAHVDIFNTPALQKFMQDNNFSVSDDESAEELPDQQEEMLYVHTPPSRPETLEEFDNFADSILGVVPSERVTPRRFQAPTVVEPAFQQEQPYVPDTRLPAPLAISGKPLGGKIYVSDQENAHKCGGCSALFPATARFCPNCGTANLPVNFCMQCGHKHQGQEKFCSDCGAKR